MSSVGRSFIRSILQLHGFDITKPRSEMKGEILVPKKNPWFMELQEKTMRLAEAEGRTYREDQRGLFTQALLAMEQEMRDQNVTGTVKVKTAKLGWAIKALDLIDGVGIVGMVRGNPLDRYVCEVRDCFDKRERRLHGKASYPVDAATGEASGDLPKRINIFISHPLYAIWLSWYLSVIYHCIFPQPI